MRILIHGKTVFTRAWASYQMRKIAGCACAGNAGNVFPATDFKGNRYLGSRHASRHVRNARAVIHVGIVNPQWQGDVLGIPGAYATCNCMYLARGPRDSELTHIQLPRQTVKLLSVGYSNKKKRVKWRTNKTMGKQFTQYWLYDMHRKIKMLLLSIYWINNTASKIIRRPLSRVISSIVQCFEYLRLIVLE